MKSHIIPQVLLRGFRVDHSNNKVNAKIKILTPKGLSKKSVRDSFQQEDFYSKEVESLLDKKFESPFGQLKKRMISVASDDENKIFNLTNSEYVFLTTFFVVMWRRNDKHLLDMERLLVNALNNQDLRKKMLPQFKDVPTSDLMKGKVEQAAIMFFKDMMKNTNKHDPTVRKILKSYRPILIHNKSNINFPVHNKYATTHFYGNVYGDYPDISFQPITNKFFIILVFDKQRNYKRRDEKIKVISISDEQMIETIVKMYVLDSATSIVVDDSNVDIIEKRLRKPIKHSIRTTSKEYRDLIKILTN